MADAEKPSHPAVDPKAIISSSYNNVAPTYHAWASKRPTDARSEYLQHLANLVPAGSPVLELGCGAGIPGTQQLVDLGFTVTGVDVSSSMIDIARREVPKAEFYVSDMLPFTPPSNTRYTCVMAFYSRWHLPPSEQAQFLEKSMEWLQPGGWLLFNLMTVDGELKMENWMGSPMISWGQGVDGNRKMVKGLADRGLVELDGAEGDVRLEMVGKHEQEMHWFLLRRTSS